MFTRLLEMFTRNGKYAWKYACVYIFTIKMHPGSAWVSKYRAELIEFEFIAQFCHHQVKNELKAKNQEKIGVFGDFWLFLR